MTNSQQTQCSMISTPSQAYTRISAASLGTSTSFLAIHVTLLYLLTLPLLLARFLQVSTCSLAMHGRSLLSHHTHIYTKLKNNPGLKRGRTENSVGYAGPLLLCIAGGVERTIRPFSLGVSVDYSHTSPNLPSTLVIVEHRA